MCTGTFRLPMADLGRMIEILQRGPDARPERGAGERGGHAPGQDSYADGGYDADYQDADYQDAGTAMAGTAMAGTAMPTTVPGTMAPRITAPALTVARPTVVRILATVSLATLIRATATVATSPNMSKRRVAGGRRRGRTRTYISRMQPASGPSRRMTPDTASSALCRPMSRPSRIPLSLTIWTTLTIGRPPILAAGRDIRAAGTVAASPSKPSLTSPPSRIGCRRGNAGFASCRKAQLRTSRRRRYRAMRLGIHFRGGKGIYKWLRRSQSRSLVTTTQERFPTAST